MPTLSSIDGLEVGRVLNGIPTIAFNAPYLRKRIDFLTALGVKKLGRVLSRHPNLLAYSVEGNMQRKASAGHPSPRTLRPLRGVASRCVRMHACLPSNEKSRPRPLLPWRAKARSGPAPRTHPSLFWRSSCCSLR
jgi:hypothetical protein